MVPPYGGRFADQAAALFLETEKNKGLHGKRYKRVIRSEGALRL